MKGKPFHTILALKALSYGLVSCCLASVVIADYLHWTGLMLFIAAAIASWFRDDWRGQLRPAVRNGILIMGFQIALVDGVLRGEWLEDALYFSLFLCLNKLWYRQRSTDYFQLYVLSFVMFVAGAVLNPHPLLMFLFPAFVVVLVLCLVVLHFLRDWEHIAEVRNKLSWVRRPSTDPESETRLRGILRPGFLTGAAGLSAAVLVGALLIFFGFPRIGLGFLAPKTRKGSRMSGFADQITLGHFGTIKSDPSVVMRVEVEGEWTGALRLRATSFERYDGRSWHKASTKKFMLAGRLEPPRTIYMVDRARPKIPVKQSIYLEPLDTPLMFGMPRLVAIQFERKGPLGQPLHEVFMRGYEHLFGTAGLGDVMLGKPPGTALRYTAISDAYVPPASVLRRASERVPFWVSGLYLQPPGRLSREYARLAGRIVQGKTTRYDRALAIRDYLRNNYRYSLEGGHRGADPLFDFLFRRRSGHCEYFASAFVVLARLVRIPARVVGGFYGGVWNPFGDYTAIRKSDAHSWAEVYFHGFGWLTFDPTPQSEVLKAEEGLMAQLNRLVDFVKLKWYTWVVEYDLYRQLSAVRQLSGWWRHGSLDFRSGCQRTDSVAPAKGVWPLVVAMVAALLVFAGVWILRRRRRASRHRWLDDELLRAPPARLYAKLTKVLHNRGLKRAPTMTPREFVLFVRRAGFPGALVVDEITAAYERWVYGNIPLPAEQLVRLRLRLKTLNRR